MREDNNQLPPMASYVKPLEVEQLPAQPASTFKPIQGYPNGEPERTPENEEDTEPTQATDPQEDQSIEDAEARREELEMTEG